MDELLKSLVCSGTECLCWILVLFNIFAVLYLVFCSFWEVSVLAKIVGWVQSIVLIGVAIGILFFHTCIYTLLATIFTGMMLMAILAVILSNPGQRAPKSKKSKKSASSNQMSSKVTGIIYWILVILTAGLYLKDMNRKWGKWF